MGDWGMFRNNQKHLVSECFGVFRFGWLGCVAESRFFALYGQRSGAEVGQLR